MAYELTLENKPDGEEVRVLLEGLHFHNMVHSGAGEAEYLAIFLRDEERQIVGGMFGWTAYGYLRIDVLWVREELRGQGLGQQLLLAAEGEGRRRGCKFATLDSFSFQAPWLYRKNGYEEIAVLDQVAGNQTWHFFKKDLRTEN